MTRKTLIYYGAALFVVFIYSTFRPVNADEGYYMLSASKILCGQVPYVDFRFHHMPLMIYVYSFISNFGYWSLVLGRLLSITFMFITSVLIYKFLIKHTTDTLIPRLFLLFYFCNAFFIDWAITIKIYSFSSLILTLAVLSFSKVVDGRDSLRNLFFSGFLFSALFMTRIVFAINFLVYTIFCFYVINKFHRTERIKFTFMAVAGLLLPILMFLFYYRNDLVVVYSNVIEEPSMIKNYVQHSYITSIFKLLLYFLLPQNLILLAILLISGFKYSLLEKFLTFHIGGYFLIHLPTQMLPEYLSNITPIFILLTMLRYQKFETNIRNLLSYKGKINIAVVILYLISMPFGIAHLKHILQSRPLMPSPLQLHTISEKINMLEGKTILSSWEGYPVFSNKISVFKERYLPVYEEVSGDTAQINKFKLASPDESKMLISAKIPDVIVYDSEEPRVLEGLSNLISTEYKKIYEFKYLTVYKK